MIDQVLIIVGVTVMVMITPGPDMVIVMRNALLGGRLAGFKTSAGILAGNLVHITYCAVGIGWLISQSIVAFSILKYAAAAYLIFLGIQTIRNRRLKSLDPRAAAQSIGNTRWFAQGFLNNLLNPKGSLFYLGVFSLVITPDTPVAVTGLLVALMMAISAAFWLAFVVTLDTRLVRQFLGRGQAALGWIFGGLLIALGLRLAVATR